MDNADKNLENTQRDAAEIALLTLWAISGAGVARSSALYKLPERPNVMAHSDAVQLLAAYPKPVSCSGAIRGGALHLAVLQLWGKAADTHATASRREVDFLLDQVGRLASRDSADVRQQRIIVANGVESIECSCSAFAVFLGEYDITNRTLVISGGDASGDRRLPVIEVQGRSGEIVRLGSLHS